MGHPRLKDHLHTAEETTHPSPQQTGRARKNCWRGYKVSMRAQVILLLSFQAFL